MAAQSNASEADVIHVVAAIIERGSDILIARRDTQSDLADFWEFPGGKIETNETPQQALRRELNEELTLTDIHIGGYIATHYERQPTRIIGLQAWRVTAFSGSIQLRCHSAYRWIKPEATLNVLLAPADRPLLQAYLQMLKS